MNRPDHMRGPEWDNAEILYAPSPIRWSPDRDNELWAYAGNVGVATLQERPHYCDRGHWKVLCELPGIDGHDGFPRYYMSKETAMRETEAFLRWRLWKERTHP